MVYNKCKQSPCNSLEKCYSYIVNNRDFSVRPMDGASVWIRVVEVLW